MQIENIRKGDHVVIVGHITERNSYPTDRTELYGGPAKVVGVCPPYVAIQPIGHPGVKTIDTRLWDLTKADKVYVAAFAESEPKPEAAKTPSASIVSGPVTMLFARSKCPVCNKGAFQKSEGEGEPVWRCDNCRAVIVEEACQS